MSDHGLGSLPAWFIELRDLQRLADAMRCSVFELGILGPHNRPQIYAYVRAATDAVTRGRTNRAAWEANDV